MENITHEKVTGWLVPLLLAVLIAILSWMSSTLHQISSTLAVSVYRLDELQHRVDTLETKVRP